jgi:osmotically-inducible protein OsmY
MKLRRTTVMLAALAALGVAGTTACTTTPEGQGPAARAGQVIDDATLTARVKTAIASDVGAKTAAQVNVDSDRGTVQLSGHVDSAEHATRAAQAAQQVDGVRSVKNDIRVRSPATGS